MGIKLDYLRDSNPESIIIKHQQQTYNLTMNNSPAPAIITFEINLEEPKCEALPAALQLRLIPNKKSYTLKEIDDKLEQAAAKRKERNETLKLPVRVVSRERIASQERAHEAQKEF